MKLKPADVVSDYRRDTTMLTSNTPTNNWDELFTGDNTLPCTLDRLFDRASAFVMKDASFRGAELEIFPVESSPMAIEMNKQIWMNWKYKNNRDCWRIGETSLAGIGDCSPTWEENHINIDNMATAISSSQFLESSTACLSATFSETVNGREEFSIIHLLISFICSSVILLLSLVMKAHHNTDGQQMCATAS